MQKYVDDLSGCLGSSERIVQTPGTALRDTIPVNLDALNEPYACGLMLSLSVDFSILDVIIEFAPSGNILTSILTAAFFLQPYRICY